MLLANRYEPTDVERKWYAAWEERGYFRPEVTADQGAASFVMVIPPPNITGSLHMGHALNCTLQDVLARYHRMDGRRTLWLPGTDHAGIATQVVVERKLAGGAEERKAMGREAFERRVWEWREESGRTIVRQLRRLGVSCDWARERFTLDEGLSRAVREVFVTLYEDGLIYRGDRLISWCVHCQTALSDLEVEYREQAGTLWHIRYGDVTVATVRPESKLGDTALAVHPDDARYAHLVGRTLTVPTESGPLELPVIADAAVDPAFGTGVVKVTPAHDPADYDMGQRHGLRTKTVIGTDGRMTAEAGRYAGLDRAEARKRVVEDLRALDLLEREEPYKHRVGVCYRCGTTVEPLISRQWFVKIQPLAEPALAAVREGRTRFVPRQWENTYFAWMENIRDWCISRQLWWGHRIPAWTCTACGEIVVARADPARCPRCAGAVEQDPDVLDTWFSSALWPFSTLGWPEKTDDLRRYYPTTVLVTAFDIIFFWVARMMMMGLRFGGDVPFRDVYIHGLVRDPLGQKMSKSKGNVVDPLGLLDTYGTDALRFALTAFTGMGRDVRVDQKRIEGYRNFANKLWNAARFVLMHVENAGPEVAETVDVLVAGDRPTDLTSAERWILSRIERTIGEVREAIEAYRFSEAADRIYQFAWHEFCDWYVEVVKKPLADGGPRADVARGVLLYCLERLCRVLHPFMPFITEEIWQSLLTEGWRWRPRSTFRDSIMIAEYPKPASKMIDEGQEAWTHSFVSVVSGVRDQRADWGMKPNQPVPVTIVHDDQEVLAGLREGRDFIRDLARASPLDFSATPPAGITSVFTVNTPSLGHHFGVASVAQVHMPLGGFAANLDVERGRLNEQIASIEREYGGVTEKLQNPEFIAKAPPERVAEVQTRASELEQRLATAKNNLRRLDKEEA